MKTNLLLMMLFLLSSVAFAEKATVPAELLDSDLPYNMAEGLIEGGDENNANQYYPEHIAEDLNNMAEELYTGGVAKIEHVLEFRCKVEELIQMEKVRAAIGDGDKKKCYKNFANRFSGACKKDWTFAQIYPIKDSDKDKFKKKYKCDGKIETKKYKKNDSESRVKAMYHTLYAMIIKQYIDKVKSDPQNKANEYEMASVKQCVSPFHRLPWVGFKSSNSCIDSSSGTQCEKHDECCSMYCRKETGEAKGKCQPEFSCYRLLDKNEECGLLANGRIHPYCDNKLIQHQLDPDNKPKPGIHEKLVECIETNFNTSEIKECTVAGKKPSSEKPCCSDKKGGDGKCVMKMTCDVCLRGGGKPTGDEKCCPGFYKSLKGVCIQDFPPLMLPLDAKVDKKSLKKSSILEKVINIIIPTAYAAGDNNNDNPGAGGDSGGCVSGVTCSNSLTAEQEEAVNGLRDSCLRPDSNSGATPSQDEIQACLLEADQLRNQFINENLKDGTTGGPQWDRAKYLSQFNMTAITTKTASDFKKCEFNSYNDSWRSASNMERNAEIVIRGFEYTFSGKGTVDYWVDKKGMSIYERAKTVAEKIRRYRSDLIKQYHEIDRSMGCKCIAILGPARFPDKMDFFNSSCAAEKEQLAESLGGADGTSSNDNLSKVEKDQATTSETDLGASGVSHEKLLMEYLEMRIDAQFDRFNANAELEKELSELSQFIIDQNWELSWEKREFLYDFKVKRTAGWITWVVVIIVIIVIVVLSIFTFGAAAAISVGVFIAVSAAVAVVGVTAAILNNNAWKNGGENVEKFVANAASRSIYASGIKRNVHDTVTKDWYTKWFKEYKHFRREYIYPYFKSGHAKDARGITGSLPADKVCEAYGSSRICFKNAHATMYDEELRFLLDAKFPEFVPENAYTSDSKFLEKVKEGWFRGITALKSEKPSKPQKTKWLEEDHIDKHKEKFLPDQGKWLPEAFDAPQVTKLANGIKSYARCIELKKCGAKYLKADDEDTFGYGFLFENEKDVNNFASYVIQHHFHWPSLSTSGMMAYPTMAMSSYFEAMVYNLKLVGSLAANRGLNMGDLYDKYKSDWDKRRKDYELGAAAQMGGQSGNSKYSKKFRMNFKRLNFKTGVGVGDFQGDNGEITGSSGFSEAEMKTMQNGVDKALRAAEHTKKSAHYMKTVGNTPRGKIKMNAQKQWAENFSAPLNNMPLSVGGQQVGMLRSTKNVTNNYGDDAPKGKVAAYVPPKYDFSSSYTPPSSGYNKKSSSGGTVPKRGLREGADHSYLLDSAAKNQEMFERDESDSLFKIVSKAYYRNLSLILKKQADTPQESGVGELELKSKKKIDKSKKDELKNLLEN